MARRWATANSADDIDVGNWNLSQATALYIGCWVYLESLTGDYRFIQKGNGTGTSDHDWMLGVTSTDELRARLKLNGVTSTFITTNSPLSGKTNTWVHVAVTYDGSNVVLYAEGDAKSTTGASGNLVTGSDTSDINIGNVPDNSVSVHGRIAEMVVMGRVPALNEIVSQHNRAPTRNILKTNVEGYWPLNGASTEPDLSGNGRNGTVNGPTVADHAPIGSLFGYDTYIQPVEGAAPGAANPKGPLGHPLHGPFGGPV